MTLKTYINEHVELLGKDDEFLYKCSQIKYYNLNDKNIQKYVYYKIFCILQTESEIKINYNKQFIKYELNPDIVLQLNNIKLAIDCYFRQNIKINLKESIRFKHIPQVQIPIRAMFQQIILAQQNKQQQLFNIEQCYKMIIKTII